MGKPRKRRGPAVREVRRRNAEERKRLRDQLTPEQQLAVLDERLGPGQGAKRERARLSALITNSADDKGGDND